MEMTKVARIRSCFNTVGNFLYKYRYLIGIIFIVISVSLELNGSSIGCWNTYMTPDNEDTGIIQIADDVVASIVGLAVTEVDGVSKLTGNITREIVAKLGKNNLSKGVVVEYDEDQKAKIDVSVEVKFGYNIMDVSKEIQDRVKQTLQTMTGIETSVINVRVSGIDFKE